MHRPTGGRQEGFWVCRYSPRQRRKDLISLKVRSVPRSGDYLSYVRNPDNGYRTIPLPFEPGRGNELSVRTR